VLVAAADAISASRPGARRDTLEKYVKRLEELEALASGFPGVEHAYAIQAGREVRVIADAGRTNDSEAIKVCHDIARAIEEQLDLVVANAENAVAGSGLTPTIYKRLRKAGIDAVTLGDHVYKKQEIIPTLEQDERLCKPANFPPEAPGRDFVLVPARNGTPVA